MLGSNVDIMSPQWTDVIFKDRNQAYGAYQLRKENARTTNRSLIIAAGVFVLALATPTIVNAIKGFIPPADPKIDIHVVELHPPPPIAAEPVKPPPVQERQVRAHNDVVRFPPPVVRPDIDTREDPPTEIQALKNDIGQENMKGDPNAPIADIDVKTGDRDIAGITEHTDSKEIFTAVEINPEYPGGEAAFGKFLQTHIRYPNVAKENNIQGRVYVQFVVERDGSLTDMKIIKDPGNGLGDEAVRVLKVSPHWRPGIQNGKPVRVQYTVPVNFALAE